MTGFAIGLFEGREAAQRVRGALVEAGCGEGAVTIFGQEAGALGLNAALDQVLG